VARKRFDKDVIEIDEGAAETLVTALLSLEVVEGWVNLTPGVPSEAIIEDRSLFSWLAGPVGPKAPLATWMPPTPGSGNSGRLGVLHSRGRLHREGIAGLVSIPSSWRCLQDHARRGLLFDVPEAAPRAMAEVMLAVVEELSTVPTTGRYLAEIYRKPGLAFREGI
jgi:hypothetical protein